MAGLQMVCSHGHSWCELVSAQPCQLRKLASHSVSSYDLTSTLFPSPLPRCSLGLGGGGEVSHLGLTTQIHSQHCDLLHISALTAAHCKKQLSWPRLRAAHVCSYKHCRSEGNMTIWPVCQITIAGSTLGSTPAMAFDHYYSSRREIPSNPIREALVPRNGHAALVGMSGLEGLIVASRVYHWSRCYLFSPATSTAHFGTVKASLQGVLPGQLEIDFSTSCRNSPFQIILTLDREF